MAPIRQLALSVGVSFGNNIPAAIGTIREVLNANPRVLGQPAPFVG
jgi:small-conductance mechanosensitive channel